ncbi:MAG: hypothetical protein IJE65_05455 [Clostridia bacterium]|nr:hypothetical protein [Clostridia bacterium]
MKKIIAIVLLLVCVLSLVACDNQDIKRLSSNTLTLDKVVELSSKGSNLTWSDFEQYESIETGSGLYILVYEIDETFDLWVGGSSPDEEPFYIRLLTKANIDNYIDIRTDNVNEFIEANKKSLLNQ